MAAKLNRVGRQNEPTPRGSEVLDELTQVMPRLVRLWAGETFSPAQSKGAHPPGDERLCSVLLAPLAKICGQLAQGLRWRRFRGTSVFMKRAGSLRRYGNSMVWHPRFVSDPLHMWLRETLRQIFRPSSTSTS